MLTLTRNDSKIRVETGGGRIEWDAAKGGLIVTFVVRDDLGEHPLVPRGAVWPDLRFRIARGAPLRLADVPAKLEIVRQEDDEAALRSVVTLGGVLRVERLYEVFPEGVLFCEMSLCSCASEPVRLAGANMAFAVEHGADRFRWGYATRSPAYGRDATRIHAFFGMRSFLNAEDSADEPELLPWVSLDFGWAPARLFSNHVEFLIEDGAPLAEGRLDEARTTADADTRQWRLNWRLTQTGGAALAPDAKYVNRWGIVFGRARTASGRKVDPACRDNLLSARIAHLGIPYLRQGRSWPWRVMQTHQSPYIKAVYFEGMPPLETADDAARGGADTVMIHQGWMANAGTNCEPPADYRPGDADWLRAFVDRCHNLGMRVGLYMRGTEMYAMYSSFFEDFLQRDRDGLYVDWSSPLAMGWAKASPVHFSAYNYFHFTRALRQRVGAGGFLQAHCGHLNTLLATAAFDSLLSGEAARQRDSLLHDPESCACFGLLGGCGACLITGNPYDRKQFSTPRATAYSAALGMASKAGLGKRGGFAKSSAHLQPLWRMLRRLPGPTARIHSEAVGTDAVLSEGDPNVFAVIHETRQGHRLLLVTHLGENSSDPTQVTLNREALRLKGSATLHPIDLDMANMVSIEKRRLQVHDLKPFHVAGFLID